jgi:hypothetical protein
MTYLPGRGETDTAHVDPIPETVRRDLQRLGELWLELRYVLETTVHLPASPMSCRFAPTVRYLPEHGEPIALCVTPDARPDELAHAQQIGELSVAWRRGNLGYVVLGNGPARAPHRERLYQPAVRSQRHSAGTASAA